MDKQDAPTLLVHGSRDPRVPLKLSEQMFAELKKCEVPAKLVVIEGAGHGFSGKDAKQASSERVAWFDKHLLGE